ncbi:MAG: 30S ribosomal protein S17 [Thermoleophilaceae bacterium]|nr:30S ribosomal protein S17 [Thermoleophilaceae bacterium]
MADEEKKNQDANEAPVEEAVDVPEPEAEAPGEETPEAETAPEAEAETPAEETPEPEAAPEVEADAPAEETPEPEPEAPAEETPAPEEIPAAEEAPAAEAPAEEEPAEPVEVIHPKERRRRKRSAHDGQTAAQRTPEQRATERAERRAARAKTRRAYREKQKQRRSSEAPREGTPTPERTPGTPKVRQGIVVSDKADKTITVRIDVTRRHRTYKKIVRESSTLHAHDESNEANAGDTVRVIESRPLSRSKRWRLVEVVEKAR